MADKLQGAYVKAWVWVYLDCPDDEITDDEIREQAKATWHKDGDCEIEEGATVSRSYKDG